MPLGILGSLAISTVLYIAVAAVLTGLVPYAQLNVADPIAKAVDVIGLGWFSLVIKLGALTGLTTVILVLLYGQSRIFYTMARTACCPACSPRASRLRHALSAARSLIGAWWRSSRRCVPIGILGEMVSIGTLLAFILVCGAVVYLRKSDAGVFRPFRVPGVPVVPVLGIAFCLLLMSGLPLITWARLVVWLAIGLAIYWTYGRTHSALRDRNRKKMSL